MRWKYDNTTHFKALLLFGETWLSAILAEMSAHYRESLATSTALCSPPVVSLAVWWKAREAQHASVSPESPFHTGIHHWKSLFCEILHSIKSLFYVILLMRFLSALYGDCLWRSSSWQECQNDDEKSEEFPHQDGANQLLPPVTRWVCIFPWSFYAAPLLARKNVSVNPLLFDSHKHYDQAAPYTVLVPLWTNWRSEKSTIR